MKVYKTILKNFVGAYLMKRHYFLMVIIIPFMVRTIGLEQYGRLEFSKSIAYYFTIFINFGFNYSATKNILLYKDDKEKINSIVSSTYMAKVVLALVGFLIILGLVQSSAKIASCKELLFTFFGLSVASAFTPGFIYQGFDKMDWLVSIDIVCRSWFVLSIFYFIQGPDDTLLYPTAYVVSDSMRTLIAITLAMRKFEIKFKIPRLKEILNAMKESTNMFVPTISRTIYDRLPQVVIGLLLGTKSTGLYVLGTKLVGEINMLTYTLMLGMYPIVSSKIKESIKDAVPCIKRFILFLLPILVLSSLLCFFFAEEIIFFIANKSVPESAKLLKISSFLPTIIFLYSIIVNTIVVPLGFGKFSSSAIATTSLVASVCYTFLLPYFKIVGVVWCIIISEIITLILVFLIARKALKLSIPYEKS